MKLSLRLRHECSLCKQEIDYKNQEEIGINLVTGEGMTLQEVINSQLPIKERKFICPCCRQVIEFAGKEIKRRALMYVNKQKINITYAYQEERK